MKVHVLWDLINKESISSSVSTPSRLLFRRHDYAGAMRKILPYATSADVVKKQKARRAIALQTLNEGLKNGVSSSDVLEKSELLKTSQTLDINFSEEPHLIKMLQDDLVDLPKLLITEGWQAYQYEMATWYFNPDKNDIYAEHPVRKKAGVLVSVASLRCNHAAGVLQRGSMKFLSKIKRIKSLSVAALNSLSTNIIRTEIELAIDTHSQDMLHVAKRERDLNEKRKEMEKRKEEEKQIEEEKQSADSKPLEERENIGQFEYKQMMTNDDDDDIENKPDLKIPEYERARYWAPPDKVHSPKHRKTHPYPKIVCNRASIDAFIHRSACCIQRHVRGYRIRKRHHSIPWHVLGVPAWKDVVSVQRKNASLRKQVGKMKKEADERKGALEVRDDYDLEGGEYYYLEYLYSLGNAQGYRNWNKKHFSIRIGFTRCCNISTSKKTRDFI